MTSIALGSISKKLAHGVGSLSSQIISMAIGAAVERPVNPSIVGPRIDNLRVQTATYGKVIPIVFGYSKLAGNIIWALPIKEYQHRNFIQNSGKTVFGKKRGTTHVNYSYSVSLAIGLCEGVVDSIVSLWADAKNITHEIKNIRIYRGTQDQLPDPLIEAYYGVGRAPAYRGLAYVVIENFPLADYANQVPNFTFEIKRRGELSDNKDRVEDNITSICMIPGSGEFVYDTEIAYKVYRDEQGIQIGKSTPINMNSNFNKADSVVSLDQLQETCPNIQWVAPVVGWFATSLNIAEAKVFPGVEFKGTAEIFPHSWGVSHFTRATAHQISLKNHSPIYGGTASDGAVVRYLDEMKRRNMKIMLYPMIFVDLPNKPWRGHMRGYARDVHEFFYKKDGYNNFILHYARLVKGRVDAFIIGSEMIGISSIRDKVNDYPAVQCLIALAKEVKHILGPEVIVTYAADWSEYHHTEGGWYNLDELWASEYIDIIGIDAYFPLTDGKNDNLSEKDIIEAWDKGNCHDFYYDHLGNKQALSPEYALKNIKYWWENFHKNPNGVNTSWTPRKKKIWFTEFGFSSLNNTTNQPNIFFDPESCDGGLPRDSNGHVDFYIQRLAINATLKKWANSEMVTNMFLWSWDARPYPSWPLFKHIWGDGYKWDKGHWINGKFGVALLSDVLLELCLRSGLNKNQVDVSKISGIFEGVAFDDRVIVADVLDLLAKLYCFQVVQLEDRLAFISNRASIIKEIDAKDLIYNHNKKLLELSYDSPQNLPGKVELVYVDKQEHYRQNIVRSVRHDTQCQKSLVTYSNIVLGRVVARKMADQVLEKIWQERTRYHIILPFQYIFINPGDVIEFFNLNKKYTIKVTKISLVTNRCLEIEGKSYFAENVNNYEISHFLPSVNQFASNIINHIIDLPPTVGQLVNDNVVYLSAAASSGSFRPITVYFIDGHICEQVATISEEATMGWASNILSEARSEIFDLTTFLKVVLISGSLHSTSMEHLLNGANLAMVGNEIIQFLNVELVENHVYILSGLLRGRMGTEDYVSGHKTRDKFILLDTAVVSLEMPLQLLNHEISYKFVPIGMSLADSEIQKFTWRGESLKPLSPVHISHVILQDNQILISWIRRTRIGGSLRDNIEIALGEDKEEYLIEVFEDNVLIETLTSVKTEVLLEGNHINKVSKVVIYQISSIVGLGNPAVYYPN